MKQDKNLESIRPTSHRRYPKPKRGLTYAFLTLLILALVGGGVFLVLKKSHRPVSSSAMQTESTAVSKRTASHESKSSPPATQTKPNEAVNQKNTHAAASDAELDQDLANLDAKINQLDSETKKTDDGLNDNPVNLN